jgi:hypothetical protein
MTSVQTWALVNQIEKIHVLTLFSSFLGLCLACSPCMLPVRTPLQLSACCSPPKFRRSEDCSVLPEHCCSPPMLRISEDCSVLPEHCCSLPKLRISEDCSVLPEHCWRMANKHVCVCSGRQCCELPVYLPALAVHVLCCLHPFVDVYMPCCSWFCLLNTLGCFHHCAPSSLQPHPKQIVAGLVLARSQHPSPRLTATI